MANKNKRILIVDDDKAMRMLLACYLEDFNYHYTCVNDGEQAWKELTSNPKTYDAILLDYIMPKLDGLGLLKRLKANKQLQDIPVIMQTVYGNKKYINECLSQGAFYYLTKPYEADTLRIIVSNALEKSQYFKTMQQQLRLAKESLALLDKVSFHFKTLDEVGILSGFLANACPDPNRAIVGISELMINAIEHGNLGIGYQKKSQLKQENRWREEVDTRLKSEAFKTRQANVSLERYGKELQLLIVDEGEGFNWEEFLSLSPERALDFHGRGIAIAKQMCFKDLEYLSPGNMVQASLS